MFSESRIERRRLIGARRSRQRRRDRRQLRRNRRQLRRNRRQLRRNRRWRRRDRRYRRERDAMLNSVLNGDWSNSVPGRKIPEGPEGMSTYRQRIDRLARHHLEFSVANCALNPRFAAVTVGTCGDSKLRRVAGEASNITENTLSILIVILSVQLQQTEISERKLFIFHLGPQGSAITPQKSAMAPQGSSISLRMWSHTKLPPE